MLCENVSVQGCFKCDVRVGYLKEQAIIHTQLHYIAFYCMLMCGKSCAFQSAQIKKKKKHSGGISWRNLLNSSPYNSLAANLTEDIRVPGLSEFQNGHWQVTNLLTYEHFKFQDKLFVYCILLFLKNPNFTCLPVSRWGNLRFFLFRLEFSHA